MGTISKSMPKVVRRWLEKHPDVFLDADYSDGYNEGYAYDILLKHGWSTDDYGLHTIIEYTAKDTINKLREIQPCDCPDCTGPQD